MSSPRRARALSTALAGLAGLSLAGVVVVSAPSPASAEPDGDDCTQVDDTERTDKQPPTEPSAPLDLLRIDKAHEVVRRLTGATPGAGVRVAVIDSGVESPGVRVYGRTRDEAPIFYHGTAMAGVIAGQPGADGPIGIAPGAEIYDVRVYDSDNSQDGATPTDASIIAGLDAVAPLAGRKPGDIRIVNVSLTVDRDTPELEAAVRRVTDAGAIVVASTGNRVPEIAPEDDGGAEDDEGSDTGYEFGEDVVKYPAGYSLTNSRVVAVGTTTDPEFEEPDTPSGLLSSAIDVVAPTFGAVSYTIDGSTCSFYRSSTSVAAAEVSGVLALLASVLPRKTTPEQLIARLEVTATGVGPSASGAVDKFRGRGVVLPVEALTRPVRPGKDGVVPPGLQPPPPATPAPLPQPEPDVLRGTRRNAVWWGLFGGGALVVAMLLRPVLSRRRAHTGG